MGSASLPLADRRAAHRRRAHRAVQLAAGARHAAASWCCASRTPTASARRPRTSSRSSTRCAGWSSTGTRARSCQASAATRHREVLEQLLDERPRLPLDARPPRTSRPARTQHGAERGFRGEPEARGRGAPARARRGRDRRARRDPRRHALPPRAPRRPGDRPRRRHGRSTTSRSRSTTSTPASPTSCAARTTSPTRPSSCWCSRRSARRQPRLRPPAAAARPRRQEALQAPRRGVGAGAARRRLPARGGAQLPRAARLGRRGRRDADPDRRARAALRHRARVAQPGALRRAEAALDERPLPARARHRRADAAAGGVHRPRPGCATPSRSRRRRSRR